MGTKIDYKKLKIPFLTLYYSGLQVIHHTRVNHYIQKNLYSLIKQNTCSTSTTDETAKPRVLRFTWSMKTTSPLMPDQIMQKIREVLDQNNCDYEQRER